MFKPLQLFKDRDCVWLKRTKAGDYSDLQLSFGHSNSDLQKSLVKPTPTHGSCYNGNWKKIENVFHFQ